MVECVESRKSNVECRKVECVECRKSIVEESLKPFYLSTPQRFVEKSNVSKVECRKVESRMCRMCRMSKVECRMCRMSKVECRMSNVEKSKVEENLRPFTLQTLLPFHLSTFKPSTSATVICATH